MAIKHRITSKHPRTGALPSEQAAAQLTELHPDNGGRNWVQQQDKLIWQLVMNCVDYASEQFGENLQFNSETLTNVLYDNIYDLLGEKVQEDEFVNWVADELVKNGAIVKTEESQKQTTEKSEPKEEVVYELDDSQYKELVSKVDASVQLLKANKLNIFKIFSETQEQIKGLSDEKLTGVELDEKNLMRLRDDQITSLVKKIQGNQKTIEDYIQTQEDNREEIQEKFEEIQDRMDTYMEERDKSISENRKILDEIKKTLAKLVKTSSELEKKSSEALKAKTEKKVSEQPKKEQKSVQKGDTPSEKQQLHKKEKEKGKEIVQKKQDDGKKGNDSAVSRKSVLEKPFAKRKQPDEKPTVQRKYAPAKPNAEKARSSVSVQPFSGVLNNPRVLETKSDLSVEQPVEGSPVKEQIPHGKSEKATVVKPPRKTQKKPVISITGKVNPIVLGKNTQKGESRKTGTTIVIKPTVVEVLNANSPEKVQNKKYMAQMEPVKYSAQRKKQSVYKKPVLPVKVYVTPKKKELSKQFQPARFSKSPLSERKRVSGQKASVVPPRQSLVQKPLVPKVEKFNVVNASLSESGKRLEVQEKAKVSFAEKVIGKLVQEKKKIFGIKSQKISSPPHPSLNASPIKPQIKRDVPSGMSAVLKPNVSPVKGKRVSVSPVEPRNVVAKPQFVGVAKNSLVHVMPLNDDQSIPRPVQSVVPRQSVVMKRSSALKPQTSKVGVLSRSSGGGGGGTPPAPPGSPLGPGGGWFGMKKLKPDSTASKKKKVQKKPTLGQRIRGAAGRAVNRVVVKVVRVKDKVKNAIAKSSVGKMFKAVKKVVTTLVKVVTKVVKTVVKVVATTVKVMWKAAKFAAKTFVKASAFVGNAVKGVITGVGRGIKNFMGSVRKKGIVRAVLDMTGAKFVTRLLWHPIKWAGKKLWKWIKKATISLVSVFKRLFKFMGKFKNTTKFYIGKLVRGIKDKAYMFIAKPIAGILQTVFAMVTGLVMAPVKFLQWAVPSILERFRNVMGDIRAASVDLFKSTWSVFKRILFNPLTIAILIGALVYFFWPKLVEWVKGGIMNIGNGILSTVMNWVSNIWTFAKKVWNVIVPIAKAIYEFVVTITDPDSWLVQIVGTILTVVGEIKNIIKRVMGFAGYDSLDFTCMWLAGDTIGLALAAIEGLCISAWKYVSNLPFIGKVISMIKALVKAKKIIADLPGVMWDSFTSVVSNVFSGKWGNIIDDALAPWTSWWGALKKSMNQNVPYDETYQKNRIKITESVSESSRKTKKDVAIATRSLRMKGMYSQTNLQYMDSISQTTNSITNKSVQSRIEHMTKLYMHNVEGLENYQKFIQEVWEQGNTNNDTAGTMLKVLLESPVLSQRLMTPFFYYNPQTAQVMMMRPAAYIGQFVQNIRKLVGTDEDRDNVQVLKTIVMAFDQMNEEKWQLVESQGRVINDFVNKVYNLNVNDKRHGDADQIILKNLTRKFNKGDMFSNIRVQQSFEQFQKNDSIASGMKSKATGEKFGNNELLKVSMKSPPSANRQEGIVDTKRSDYVVKKPEPPPTSQGQTQFGNINVGPDMSPFDSQDTLDRQKVSREDMYKKFDDYEKKRQEMVAKYDSVDKASAAGYKSLTFEQFVKRYENTTKTLEQKDREKAESEQDRAKKLAGLRMVKSIQEWQAKGKDVDEDENFVTINGKDTHSIWNLNTDGIEQDLYLFSPEWKKITQGMKISDDVLLQKLSAGGKSLKNFLGIGEGQDRTAQAEEWGESVGEEETEDQRLDREEREQREMERAALDFSAKVNNGYIEIKVQEDSDEIQRAWYQNQKLYNEMRKTMTREEVNKRGVYSFIEYDDFKSFWRKKNGHPLDGIRRYKFQGKPVEHKVDFQPRKPFSIEEMKSHGVEVSETGPVMIPADKAMQIAKSLFSAAKTVYSIRDGLEIMKMGVDHENEELKKRNKRGPAIAAVGISAPVGQNGVHIQSPEPQAKAS